MKLTIMGHNNTSFHPIKIDVIEEHYNAKFVGDFCVKTKGGGWSEIPVAVFYQPNPDFSKGHTHYFGIFCDPQNKLMITDASSAFDEPIEGIIADNGEVIFSRYRHDYRSSMDRSVTIDGGRDYLRCGGSRVYDPNRHVKLIPNGDKLVIQGTKETPVEGNELIFPKKRTKLGYN